MRGLHEISRAAKGLVQCKFPEQQRNLEWFTISGLVVLWSAACFVDPNSTERMARLASTGEVAKVRPIMCRR
jgi:hypothetical protein